MEPIKGAYKCQRAKTAVFTLDNMMQHDSLTNRTASSNDTLHRAMTSNANHSQWLTLRLLHVFCI